MSFKFAVGQAVEYKPVGASVGLFKVTRQMPEEFQAIDRRYRIKSDHEGFERNVMECDLNAAAGGRVFDRVIQEDICQAYDRGSIPCNEDIFVQNTSREIQAMNRNHLAPVICHFLDSFPEVHGADIERFSSRISASQRQQFLNQCRSSFGFKQNVSQRLLILAFVSGLSQGNFCFGAH